MSQDVRIVPATRVGNLSRLEPLARAIFGDGDRAPGWFERKLHRECVDPSLSRVVVAGRAEDPNAWLGYALVGTPPSLAPAARTAGVGVAPTHRGRGLGGRLIEAIADACQEAGHTALRTPVEPPRRAFYRRHGFVLRRGLCTVLSRSTGGRDPDDAARAWEPDPQRDTVELFAWLCEAWERTPQSNRRTLEATGSFGRVGVHFSREGAAWVGHRAWLEPEGRLDVEAAAEQITAMRDRFVSGAPVLLAALDPVSSITSALRSRGWATAQDAILMQRLL